MRVVGADGDAGPSRLCFGWLGDCGGEAARPQTRRRPAAVGTAGRDDPAVDLTPDQLKLGFALWNRQAVAQLVQAEWGVQLPVRTIGHYLKRWGFTPQKLIKKAQEPRPAEAQRWLEETYPQIARRAKTEGAEIHWGDEAGLCSDDVRGSGCAPKGQTPIVRTNNKRKSLRIISTVTNQGKVRWKMFEGAIHADVLIDFLKRLVKDAGRKVFLILDNLKVHPARKAKAWLADHEKQI